MPLFGKVKCFICGKKGQKENYTYDAELKKYFCSQACRTKALEWKRTGTLYKGEKVDQIRSRRTRAHVWVSPSSSSAGKARGTSTKIVCHYCKTVYKDDLTKCPHCGAPPRDTTK